MIKHSFKIKPINSVEEGIKKGSYDWHYDFITDKTVPLKKAEGEKKIFLVCFEKRIGESEYVELLKKEGLKPCNDAPNYLLGLMAEVKEEEMPIELKNIDIIASNSSSVFRPRYGDPYFLYVRRRDRSYRELGFVRADGDGWSDSWAFLAEKDFDTKIVSPIESSITLTLTHEEHALLKKVLERAVKY